MDDSVIELCPCESGLAHIDCCGVAGRTALNADVMLCLSNEGVSSKGTATAQIQSALENLSTRPDLFPARINFFENKAYFVKMSPRWYQESVFLDPGRIKGSYVIESNLQYVQQICESIKWKNSAYIFHTAFCGSTLMSQALAAVFSSLPVREPEALGNLLMYLKSPGTGNVDKQAWLSRVLRLLSRRHETKQTVVVKANDYANPLMIEWLNFESRIPMLFMYTPLREFLVGCLKADNRKQWLQQRYESQKTVMRQFLQVPETLVVEEHAYAEMAAMYWSYNIALYWQAWRQANGGLRSLDFNHMLLRPAESIEACGRLFDLQKSADVDMKETLDSLFGVYSKNNKFSYSPQQRSSDINKLLTNYQQELEIAENLARRLLGGDYPDEVLPGNLLA